MALSLPPVAVEVNCIHLRVASGKERETRKILAWKNEERKESASRGIIAIISIILIVRICHLSHSIPDHVDQPFSLSLSLSILSSPLPVIRRLQCQGDSCFLLSFQLWQCTQDRLQLQQSIAVNLLLFQLHFLTAVGPQTQ